MKEENIPDNLASPYNAPFSAFPGVGGVVGRLDCQFFSRIVRNEHINPTVLKREM